MIYVSKNGGSGIRLRVGILLRDRQRSGATKNQSLGEHQQKLKKTILNFPIFSIISDLKTHRLISASPELYRRGLGLSEVIFRFGLIFHTKCMLRCLFFDAPSQNRLNFTSHIPQMVTELLFFPKKITCVAESLQIGAKTLHLMHQSLEISKV